MSETNETKSFDQKIDYVLNKVIPKKLIVFITATILLVIGILDVKLWTIITATYLGTDAINLKSIFTGFGSFAKQPEPPGDKVKI